MMKNTRYKTLKKGFVLSLVLWIVAAMMVLVLLFIKMSKAQTDIYAKMHQKLEVELAAQSLFEKISYYIATGTLEGISIHNNIKGFPSSLKLDANEFNLIENNITCICTLLSHNAHYNLRFLTSPIQAQHTIENIIGKSYAFNEIYMDWIDKDDFTRLGGAERSDYMLSGYGYTPPNFPYFQHKDAIVLLKDLDKLDMSKLEKIKKHFSIHGSAMTNILLMDKEMLSAFFPSYNQAEVKVLLQQREKNPAHYGKVFAQHYPDINMYSMLPSKVITLYLHCQKNQIASKFTAIVDFKATNSRSLSILEINK